MLKFNNDFERQIQYSYRFCKYLINLKIRFEPDKLQIKIGKMILKKQCYNLTYLYEYNIVFLNVYEKICFIFYLRNLNINLRIVFFIFYNKTTINLILTPISIKLTNKPLENKYLLTSLKNRYN